MHRLKETYITVLACLIILVIIPNSTLAENRLVTFSFDDIVTVNYKADGGLEGSFGYVQLEVGEEVDVLIQPYEFRQQKMKICEAGVDNPEVVKIEIIVTPGEDSFDLLKLTGLSPGKAKLNEYVIKADDDERELNEIFGNEGYKDCGIVHFLSEGSYDHTYFEIEVVAAGSISEGYEISNGQDNGVSGSIPWGVAVGSMAAIAAAAAALISKAKKAASLAKKTLKQKPKKDKQRENKEEKEEQDEIIGYILQLSTDQVILNSIKPQTLEIKAWQINSKSGYQHAPHAVLQLKPPPASSGLAVSPLNGQGSMTLSIAKTGKAEAGNFQSTVTASADGMGTSATINITVEFDTKIEAYFEPKEAIYPDTKDGTWLYARVVNEGEVTITNKKANDTLTFTPADSGSNWLAVTEKQQVDDWVAVWICTSETYTPGSLLKPPTAVSIEVTAQIGEYYLSETLSLGIIKAEARLEVHLEPKKVAIYPDGKDGVWVYARVVAEGDLPAEQFDEANRNIDFIAVGAGSEWAGISEKQQIEGWIAAWVVAWNYDARGATLTPPPSIEIEAFTYIGETKLTETITIELLEMPQLKLELDRLEFLEGGQVSEKISAVVDPPGENQNWDFSYEWEEDFNGIRVAIIEHLNNQARFELAEQGTAEKGSKAQQDWANLKIFARQDEVILERHLRVVISREGLYAVRDYRYRDDIYRVNADGEKIPLEIGFQLLVWNEEKKCLEGDRERIIDLAFQPKPLEEIHNKALLTGDLNIKSTGLREQTIPVGLYEFTINNELPGNGELHVFPVTASVDDYSTEFNFGIQIKEIDPMADRNLELQRIQIIIDRHVPDQLKEQLQNKLDQEKINVLNGAEELYLLRHDIWEKARDAWHAEAANYKQNAAFNDWCVYALDWVVWAGDKAFEKAIELKIKAVSGNNQKLVKFSKYIGKLTRDLTIDAINAYIYENKTPDEWLYDLIVPITDQIYAGIGDALWKQLMDSLGYEKQAKWIDDCFNRNIYNADGSKKDGLELDAGIQLAFFEVLEKIMDYIISEAKKKAWKMALDYMKETEIRIEYRPHMEVRIPGAVFVWCCKRLKTFYDNYYTKEKTLLEAAKATVFKWVDEETDKYLNELEKLEAKKKEPKTGRKKETGQELIDRLKLNPEQLSEKRKNEILKLISENKSLKGYKVDFKKLADLHWQLPQ